MERAALLAEKLRADIASQIPALNTARSMGPRVLVMLRDASATAAASVTSRGRGAMPGYWRAISASMSPDRADAATFTPRGARATAKALPMPELAPVIQAVRQGADMRQPSAMHRLHERPIRARKRAGVSLATRQMQWGPGSATGRCSMVSS